MATVMLCRALLLLSKERKENELQNAFKLIDLQSKTNCRICFQAKGSISIFNKSYRPNIIRDLFIFTGVKIKLSRKVSNVICQNCLDLLDGCTKFRNMCRRNQKMLKLKVMNLSTPKKEKDKEQENSQMEMNSNDMLDIDYYQGSQCKKIQSETCKYICEKKSECKYCSIQFDNWQQYNSHLPCEKPKVKRKTKYKYEKQPSLCDVCGKVFTSAQILLGHKATHSNVFAYKCAKCPYESRYRAYLVIHMRSHMSKSERPYKCKLCPSTAATASNLASHVRRVHTTERPFKCASCEKTFRCKSDVTNHTRLVHLRKMTVECNICYKTFNSKKYLKSHNWKVHKIKPEKSNLPNKLPSYIQYRAKMEEESYADNIEGSLTNRDDNVYYGPLL